MSDLEITETKDSTEIEELTRILQEVYPKAEIKYIDYTNVNDPEKKPYTFQQEEKYTETFINPIGEEGGHYRAELFVHGISNSIVDPHDEKNRIVMYPSFDKDYNVTTIRLLRYPNLLLQSIKEDFIKKRNSFKLPYDNLRVKQLPKVRNGSSIRGDGVIICFDPVLNSESYVNRTYKTERIQEIKKKTKPVKWGQGKSLLPYKNNSGEKIFLFI